MTRGTRDLSGLPQRVWGRRQGARRANDSSAQRGPPRRGGVYVPEVCRNGDRRARGREANGGMQCGRMQRLAAPWNPCWAMKPHIGAWAAPQHTTPGTEAAKSTYVSHLLNYTLRSRPTLPGRVAAFFNRASFRWRLGLFLRAALAPAEETLPRADRLGGGLGRKAAKNVFHNGSQLVVAALGMPVDGNDARDGLHECCLHDVQPGSKRAAQWSIMHLLLECGDLFGWEATSQILEELLSGGKVIAPAAEEHRDDGPA